MKNKIYTASIEFNFESNINIEKLKQMLQVCLIKQDDYGNISTVILDNANSEEFCIIDYSTLYILEN